MPAFTAINPGRFGPNLCADLMICSCVLCGNGRLNKASTAFACEAYVLLLFVVNFVVVVLAMAIGVDDDFDENDDALFKATEENDDDDVDATEPRTKNKSPPLKNICLAAAAAVKAVAEGFVAAAARLHMMPSLNVFFCGSFSLSSDETKEIRLLFSFVSFEFFFCCFSPFFVVSFFTSSHKKATTRKVKLLFLVVLVLRESFKRTTLTTTTRVCVL
jgi:hypothetical protein